MEPQADFGWIMSPSIEMDFQLGPKIERGSDYGDPFTELLIDARETFMHRDPDFVLNNPRAKMRTAEIAHGEVAELVFEYWNERRRGFWMLDLGNQEKYVHCEMLE
jgi:hypothetical protein